MQVPKGTILIDANTIIQNDKIFTDSRNGVSAFSDWFRYELLYKNGGWWVDVDQLCLKPFDFENEYIFSSEHDGEKQKTNVGVIKVPKHSDIMNYCIEKVKYQLSIKKGIDWGSLGLEILNSYLDKHKKYNKFIQPPEIFCPIPYYNYFLLFNNLSINFTGNVYGVHLWNEMLRINNYNTNNKFHENSYYERAKKLFSVKEIQKKEIQNTNTPAISIVMPVYNSSKYLRETIESIIEQTFSNFELIIIDDGSSDDSLYIIESFIDKRIIVIKNKHDYIDSLNKGLKKAKGKYIARMDADDVMLRNRLEKQYNYMEKNTHIDVCGSWVEYIGDKKGILNTVTENDDISINLLFGNMLVHPSTIIRKQSIDEFGIKYSYGYPFAEDYKLWTDCIQHGLRFSNIPEVLLNYRISDKQVTSRHYDKMLESTSLIRYEYAEYVMNLFADKNHKFHHIVTELETSINNNHMSAKSFFEILKILYREYLNEI